MATKTAKKSNTAEPLFVGIDYSMTSPAMAFYEGDPSKFSWTAVTFYVRTDSLTLGKDHQPYYWCEFARIEQYSSSTERFDQISNWAMNKILLGCHPVWTGTKQSQRKTFIGMEDYALGARGKVFEIAENTGLLKYKLRENKIPFQLIAPTTIKKFATGKGNADKTKMYEAWMKETDYDIQKILTPKRTKLGSPVTDIVDSYFILKYLIEECKNGKYAGI